MIWWQSSEPCVPSPSALLQAALQEAQCSRAVAVLTRHHRHSDSAGLIPLMGALGPHCNSAFGARELGNITTALPCVVHAGTWWNMNREGKSWLPVESVGVLTLLQLVQDYTPRCFYWLEVSHLHMDSSHSWDHHVLFIAIFILHPSCFATVINGRIKDKSVAMSCLFR